MISRIFRSVFFMTILTLILGLGLSVFISSYLSLKQDSEKLRHYTQQLAHVLDESDAPDLRLLDTDIYRINIINSDGDVLYDSHMREETLENHSKRIEFIQAKQYGHSEVHRYSTTLGKRTVYYALKLADGRVLRASFTSDSIISLTRSLILHILLVFTLAVIVSVFLAKKLSASIVKPINNLNLNNPEENDCYDELKPLLNRIAEHQKRIKKLLRKVTASHVQLKTLTTRLSEGIVLLNKKGEILLLNNSAKAIFSKNTDDNSLIGKPLVFLSQNSVICSVYEKRSQLEFHKQNIELNGKYFSLIFNKIEDDSKLLGYVLLLVDITKERELQLQRQEFAANVSHELKTPLQSIIGRAELIENGIVKKDDLPVFGARIKHEGQTLLCMINDIMFLSRVESGVKAKKEKFNIRSVADTVVENLNEKALSKKITVLVNCPDNVIYFTKRYFYEILNNLIDNAIKYNKEEGRVDCTITVERDNIFIKVSDTGIGIPYEDSTRIFERFFTVDRSHSNRDSTGLGLTIVKHIVQECNGQIKVDSKLGEGTSFSLNLHI